MTKNVGNIERIIRIVAGGALIAWALGLFGAAGPVWAWIGVVPLATGLIGWCPPYSLLGISTCSVKDKS